MADGMKHAPRATAVPVLGKGEFRFGVIGLDHGHILGMTHGLIDAGGALVAVYDPNEENLAQFTAEFRSESPALQILRTEDELLQLPDIQLVASAAVPADRGPLGQRVMDHGKHYFSDNAPSRPRWFFERERSGGILIDHNGEHHINAHGKVGFPYFGRLILDCLNGTEAAMTQEHTFRAAELCLLAERDAVRIESTPVP